MTEMDQDTNTVGKEDEPSLERRDMVLSRRAALRSSIINWVKVFLDSASSLFAIRAGD